jgi:hypothetical protein
MNMQDNASDTTDVFNFQVKLKSSQPALSISSSVKQCSGNEVIRSLKLDKQQKVPSGIRWNKPFVAEHHTIVTSHA